MPRIKKTKKSVTIIYMDGTEEEILDNIIKNERYVAINRGGETWSQHIEIPWTAIKKFTINYEWKEA